MRVCSKSTAAKLEKAAKHLGRALHSVQDWWAHGDYSKGPYNTSDPHGPEYDTWGLDAVGTFKGKMPVNGRAPQALPGTVKYVFDPLKPPIMPVEIDWPFWAPGTLRTNGTTRDSKGVIREFLDFIKKVVQQVRLLDIAKIDTANESKILAEYFRTLSDEPEIKAKPPEFRQLLKESQEAAWKVFESLSGNDLNKTTAVVSFDKLRNTCTSCHMQFRN